MWEIEAYLMQAYGYCMMRHTTTEITLEQEVGGAGAHISAQMWIMTSRIELQV